MLNESIRDRFKDAPWFTKMDVIVGGCGGIGSWLTLLLAKLGYNIYLYDFDIVEESNIGGQLYGLQSIGLAKTAAIKNIVNGLTSGFTINEMGKYEKDSSTANIVFSAFDNMAARKLMFDNWKEHQLSKTKEYKEENPDEINVFIDGRLEAEFGMVYVVDSKADILKYEEEFFSDEELPANSCTFRATSHSGAMIASFMIGILTNKVSNKKLKLEVRTVPFKFDFHIPMLKTEVIE